MKTKILLFLLIATTFTFGQSLRRTSLGLEIGPSIPLDDFASDDYTLFSDSTSSFPGFAKTGMVVRMVFDHRLTHNFGFQGDFLFGYNNVDQEVLAEQLGKKWNAQVSVTSTRPWNLGGILAGMYFRIPFGETFSIIARAKVGGTGVYLPEYKIIGTSNEDGSKLEYYQYVDNTFSFIWSAGGGLRYRLTQYSFNLFADYFGSQADFKDVSGQDWSKVPPVETDHSFRQTIKAVSITFGISYIF